MTKLKEINDAYVAELMKRQDQMVAMMEAMEDEDWELVEAEGLTTRCSVCGRAYTDKTEEGWGFVINDLKIREIRSDDDEIRLYSIHSVICPEDAAKVIKRELRPGWK